MNLGPLVLESTTLPTGPHLQPLKWIVCSVWPDLALEFEPLVANLLYYCPHFHRCKWLKLNKSRGHLVTLRLSKAFLAVQLQIFIFASSCFGTTLVWMCASVMSRSVPTQLYWSAQQNPVWPHSDILQLCQNLSSLWPLLDCLIKHFEKCLTYFGKNLILQGELSSL